MVEIFIIGARGHGREIASIIEDINVFDKKYDIGGFIDDDPELWGNTFLGYPVVGNMEYLLKNHRGIKHCILGIGDPKIKRKIYESLKGETINWPNIVHPSVRLFKDVQLGKGIVIFPGTVISTNVGIGDLVCINSNSSISHDVILKDFSTINPGCCINGEVVIGCGAYLGSGAIVKDECTIGDWSIIGAGAVVINDVDGSTTVVGVPAIPIKKMEASE